MVLISVLIIGIINALLMATCLCLSFPRVKLALLIRVYNGIPKVNSCDVFLGNVVISRTLI